MDYKIDATVIEELRKLIHNKAFDIQGPEFPTATSATSTSEPPASAAPLVGDTEDKELAHYLEQNPQLVAGLRAIKDQEEAMVWQWRQERIQLVESLRRQLLNLVIDAKLAGEDGTKGISDESLLHKQYCEATAKIKTFDEAIHDQWDSWNAKQISSIEQMGLPRWNLKTVYLERAEYLSKAIRLGSLISPVSL